MSPRCAAILLLSAWLLPSRSVAQNTNVADWWSFRSLTRPALPLVKNSKWARNEIDHFVLASLEQKKISPPPEVERRTLIRRLWFDLIGLPPSPEEVRTFEEDKSRDA